MKITVQMDNLKALQEAVSSNCDSVRFGSEFCEWKIPNLSILKKAYMLVQEEKKQFIYITPKVSNSNLEKVQEHLKFLNDVGSSVVFNDLGIYNLLTRHTNLEPHLGRQLIYIAARCPWIKFTESKWREKRKLERIYYQTSLNFEPMITFLKDHGIRKVDLDWIPACFPHFTFLRKKGLTLTIYMHLIPVTLTRKCHMARFFGEANPENCSRKCNEMALLLNQKIMNLKLFLCGNTVFRFVKPYPDDIKMLKSKVEEFIIMMNPVTKIQTQEELNKSIAHLHL